MERNAGESTVKSADFHGWNGSGAFNKKRFQYKNY